MVFLRAVSIRLHKERGIEYVGDLVGAVSLKMIVDSSSLTRTHRID
jgi:hypothetical protein